MIELIFGAKGTGKTTRIIDKANASVENAKGNVVFIKGMIAGNTDICEIYIDGIARIGSVDPVEFVPKLDEIATRYNVKFTLTLSMAEIPAPLKRYI